MNWETRFSACVGIIFFISHSGIFPYPFHNFFNMLSIDYCPIKLKYLYFTALGFRFSCYYNYFWHATELPPCPFSVQETPSGIGRLPINDIVVKQLQL